MKINFFSQRLYALQALRAYAAAIVVFVHSISTYETKIGVASSSTMFNGLGEFGVKLFFCISGFIIYKSTKDVVPAFGSVIVFWSRRIIRVVPIYWLATIVYSGKIVLVGQELSLSNLLKSLFFIPFVNADGLMRPILGVGWSLNFEIFFYVLFGFSLIFSNKFRIWIVCFLLFSFIAGRFLGLVEPGLFFLLDCLYLLSDYYLFYFISGLLLGACRERFIEMITGASIGFYGAFVGCTVVLALYLNINFLWSVPDFLREFLMFFFCTFCVAISVCEFDNKNVSSYGLFSRVSCLSGDASYSTYLTHGFVMGPLARLVALCDLKLSFWLFSLVMIPLCTLVGVAVYLWVERPLTKKLNSVLFNFQKTIS